MADKLEAHVQYDDMLGTVAVDWASVTEYRELATKAGIDLEEFFVIGIDIYGGEKGYSEVSFLTVETAVVGSSADAIQNYVKEHGGILPAVRLGSSLKLEDVIGPMKRLSIVMTAKWLKGANFELV